MNPRQHDTCVVCMREGERAGLNYHQIMVMSKSEFDRALKNHYEREARKVIPFDPKRKLPKPEKK